MLTLYTEYDKCNVITDVEAWFYTIQNRNIDFSKKVYRYIMKTIDNAKYIGDMMVETPYGKTLVTNLSSGCKATLLAVHYAGTDTAVSLDECGSNAIDLIFKLSEKVDIKAYTSSYIVPNYEEARCIIDGKLYTGDMEIYKKLRGTA